ncbi:MvaI/BcnI family restriction endonuclease [Synechococcus sp. R5-12]|uniref:MvaI/BcnI family restriction endonuclease n=1 Tax=Synechococcus sp. R5-12 TaxID=2421321 RepID=UPI0039C6EDE0
MVGQDLRQLADQLNVTVWSKDNKKNKGWAGHTIERYLGLALNSSRSPNFGSWELKLVPLVVRVVRGSRVLRVKETMAITMIDPVEVESREFEESHLFNKLQRIVVVARIFESQADERSIVHSVASFDLNDPEIYDQVKADYNLVRETIRTKGFSSLSGKMGKLVQPRTKGQGHGSTSRAFYARKEFVAHILGLRED